MHYPFAAGAIFAASFATVAGQGDCSGAQNLGGNWYCSAVDSIVYSGFPTSGSYNGVKSMGEGGQCEFGAVGFDGPLGVFNEELSVHLRGPASLKKLAVYSGGGGGTKRDEDAALHAHSHARDLNHRHARRFGQSQQKREQLKARAGSWNRQAYYDAAAGTAEGLVFLNHKGGQGSGVFDTINGNSLSYASSDAQSGASSPQVLNDVMLEDNTEIAIMSDRKCDGDCGAVRPGTVAHHGWSGPNKAFIAEISMPSTGKTGFNADMPSYWLLNAAIPRTNQYGDCSCWKGGCGEFDIIEVLDSGNTRAKSTVHAVASGGDSNYFDRPTGNTVHVAAVFNGDSNSVHIKVLASFDYSGSLSSQQIDDLTGQSAKASTFSLGA